MNLKGLLVSLFVVSVISVGCGEPSRQEQINHMEKQVDVLVENLEKTFKKMPTLDPQGAAQYKSAQEGFAKLEQHGGGLRAMLKDFLRDCDEADLPVMREIVDLTTDLVKEIAKVNGPAEFQKASGSFKSRAEGLDKRFKSHKPKQKTLEAAAKFAISLQKLGVPVSLRMDTQF